MDINFNQMDAINQVAEIVHRNAVEKGFHNFDESDSSFISRACMLKVTEIAEMYEAFRNNKLTDLCDKSPKMVSPLTNEEEEIADLIIRALDYSRRRKLNVGRAVAIKHAYNTTREYRHGGKAA